MKLVIVDSAIYRSHYKLGFRLRDFKDAAVRKIEKHLETSLDITRTPLAMTAPKYGNRLPSTAKGQTVSRRGAAMQGRDFAGLSQALPWKHASAPM